MFLARMIARVMMGAAMAAGRSQNPDGQPVPQRQVRPVGMRQHGGVPDAHPGDVAGLAGAVAAAVRVPGGGGGERHRAEDEQVQSWAQRTAASAAAVANTVAMAR